MTYRRVLLFGIVLLGWGWGLVGQTNVSIAARFLSASPTIGEPVRYEVTLEYPSSMVLAPPVFTPDSTGVVDPVEVSTTLLSDGANTGKARSLIIYDLAFFQTGTVLVPTQNIVFDTPSTPVTIDVPSRPITIQSVLAQGDTAPAGLDEPISVSLTWWPLVLGVGVMVLFTSGVLGWIWFRRRRLGQAATPELDVKDQTLAALRQLASQTMWSDWETQKTGLVTLTTLLKGFLGAKSGHSLTDLTSDEFLSALRDMPQFSGHYSAIQSILAEADQVKFAHQQLDQTSCQTLVKQVGRVVAST